MLVLIVARGGHAKASEIMSASVPVLLAVLVIVLFPAIVLEHVVEDLVSTPAFLVMLPPFVAIAGNLGAILASRLSSAAHLGLITMSGPPDRLVLQNLGVIMILSVLTFGALAVLVYILSGVAGFTSPGVGPLLFISLIGGLLLTVATCFAAYRVTVYTFRKGDDPDNVVIPIITSTMDALGTALLVVLFMMLVF
jgi:mgtE-like transporter